MLLITISRSVAFVIATFELFRLLFILLNVEDRLNIPDYEKVVLVVFAFILVLALFDRLNWYPIWKWIGSAIGLAYRRYPKGFLGLQSGVGLGGNYRGHKVTIESVEDKRLIRTSITVHLQSVDGLALSFEDKHIKLNWNFVKEKILEKFQAGQKSKQPVPALQSAYQQRVIQEIRQINQLSGVAEFDSQFKVLENNMPDVTRRLLGSSLVRQGLLKIKRQGSFNLNLRATHLHLSQDGLIRDPRYLAAILDFLIDFAVSAERMRLYR